MKISHLLPEYFLRRVLFRSDSLRRGREQVGRMRHETLEDFSASRSTEDRRHLDTRCCHCIVFGDPHPVQNEM